MVVLPEVNLHGTEQIAKRLRLAVQEAMIPHEGVPGSGFVTVSAGIAATNDLGNLQDAVFAAYEALYRAKATE